MSDPQRLTSSRGRVIKKTGMAQKQMEGLKKLKDLKKAGTSRLDQYQVSLINHSKSSLSTFVHAYDYLIYREKAHFSD